jgi:hypothetical protein
VRCFSGISETAKRVGSALVAPGCCRI